MQSAKQRTASDAVADELGRRGLDKAWLANATGLDPGTVHDFLARRRWPKVKTLAMIDVALGWPPGTLRRVGLGDPLPAEATTTVGEGGSDPAEQRLIEGWRRLSPSARLAVSVLVNELAARSPDRDGPDD